MIYVHAMRGRNSGLRSTRPTARSWARRRSSRSLIPHIDATLPDDRRRRIRARGRRAFSKGGQGRACSLAFKLPGTVSASVIGYGAAWPAAPRSSCREGTAGGGSADAQRRRRRSSTRTSALAFRGARMPTKLKKDYGHQPRAWATRRPAHLDRNAPPCHKLLDRR